MLGGILLSVALAACYVAPLQLVPGSRDEAGTIKARMACTSAYCCIAWIPVHLYTKPQSPLEFCHLVGLRPELGSAMLAAVIPLATTVALFLGPLTLQLKEGLGTRCRQRYSQPMWRSAAAWRDLLVAPCSEEFVFRALMLAVLREAGLSPGQSVLAAPLFGLAHLHHLRDHLRYKQWPTSRILQVVAAQFLYTTVFGWLVSWYFVKFRNLLACIIPHMFCNWQGFPDFPAMRKHKQAKQIAISLYSGICLFLLLLSLQFTGSQT